MSQDKNIEPTNKSTDNTSQEDERKKQFERMKEKFGKQNGPNSGGNKNTGGNSGNNFYWIYGIVIAVLLFIVFYGNNFNSKLVPITQGQFFQEMLAKGDVKNVVIVNKTFARISIDPDSAATSDRYKNDKTSRSYFPDKNYKGPHFVVSIPSIDNFLIFSIC